MVWRNHLQMILFGRLSFQKTLRAAPVDEFFMHNEIHATIHSVRVHVCACVAQCHLSLPTFPTGNYLRCSREPALSSTPIIGIVPMALKGTVRVPITAGTLPPQPDCATWLFSGLWLTGRETQHCDARSSAHFFPLQGSSGSSKRPTAHSLHSL